MNKKPDYPILSFKSPGEWRRWLDRNHAKAGGVWLRFFKKASGVPTIVYAEALEEALCYGWIDSQAKKYDELSYIQKFTPRSSKSIWSKINRDKVTALLKTGRVKAAGQAVIDAAKEDGRWHAAYDSPKSIQIPPEFLKALRANKAAAEFYRTLNRANTYAIAWRLQTAKRPATREKRIAEFVKMLASKKKFHS